MLNPSEKKGLVLVTGATGYIGGRLVPQLLGEGYRVRCLVRDSDRLKGRDWFDKVEIIQGDLLKPETVLPALEGVSVAYYLVHSMGAGSGFHERDLNAAEIFGRSAEKEGVGRIIYLGALAKESAALSEHLKSRQQTAEALRAGGVPVTEFRAGVIVGSGSLSFELIRYLTERIPIMICPRWVFTKTQPIGIREVLAYLAAALKEPETADKIIEIGGEDVITYGDMMKIYAEVRGLKRWLVPVPVLTPRLSSYWVHLVTPIPTTIAKPLIEGLRNESIVSDPVARTLFPEIKPVSYRISVERALSKLDTGQVSTSWSDALSTSSGDIKPVELTTQEGIIQEHRAIIVRASAEQVYKVLTSLGGNRGWLYMNWAWRLRGLLDRMIGGVGLRRGRRDPVEVRVGDALDFWRVEAVEPDRLMRLRAEMKVPGRAWLQFQVKSREDGTTLLTQTAFFASKGFWGWVYWYALYPVHRIIFSGLIKHIAMQSNTEYSFNVQKM